MDRVLSEIIIGAVILTLLISVIPIYRNSTELVSAVAEKMDENETIKEVRFGRLPTEGDICSGRYLLELIEYAALKYHFLISVDFSDRIYRFRNDTYVGASQVIKDNLFFQLSAFRKNGDTIELDFICQDADVGSAGNRKRSAAL